MGVIFIKYQYLYISQLLHKGEVNLIRLGKSLDSSIKGMGSPKSRLEMKYFFRRFLESRNRRGGVNEGQSQDLK